MRRKADFTVVCEIRNGCEVVMRNFNSIEEAIKFCDGFGWCYEDLNGVIREMVIRDNRI